jgi:three-Cys-motif partner protein
MSKPLGTVWNLEPHTAKKHEILRRYFEAWLPIMASWNGRVVYIDGFAGPGKYSNGEDGSPVVVLKAARDHTNPMKAELVCIFVEDDVERWRHLTAVRLQVEQIQLVANIA